MAPCAELLQNILIAYKGVVLMYIVYASSHFLLPGCVSQIIIFKAMPPPRDNSSRPCIHAMLTPPKIFPTEQDGKGSGGEYVQWW